MRTVTSYSHPPPAQAPQVADTAPGPYYVSIRDGDRFGLLAGPFATHREALDLVERARAAAHEANPVQAAFAGFGTCRMRTWCTSPGRLNEALGVTPTFGGA